MFISILYVNIANLKSVPIEIFAEILNVFMIVRNIRQNSDVFYICSRHEANLAGLERVAATQVPNVHLEAMEEAKNKGGQFKEAGNTGRQGLPMGQFQTGLLAVSWKPGADTFHYKRNARTGGIF